MRVILIHEDNDELEAAPIVSTDRFLNFDDFLKFFPIHKKNFDPFLLVVHGSNSEFEKYAPPNWLEAETGEHLLPYLAKRICQMGGRVMVVSGGNPAHVYDMRHQLEIKGFNEFHHFLTRIVPGDIDWSRLPINLTTDWKIETLARSTHLLQRLLIPLAILGQGFLAVVALEGSPPDPEIDEILTLLGWPEYLEQDGARLQPAKGASEEVRSPAWWKIDGLDELAQRLLSSSHEEPWKSAEPSMLLVLVRQILDGQEVEAIAVARAVRSLIRILERINR